MKAVGGRREAVLAEAVRAYRLAKKRATLQKDSANGHRRIGREEVESLEREFPEAYSMRGGQLIYSGRSAEQILDDYVQGLGKPPRARLWFQLAGIVVARGERVLLQVAEQ